MNEKNKLNIALIVGGASAEREVSKHSSISIYNSLLELGYSVTLIDPGYGLNQPKQPQDFFSEKDLFPISARNYLEAVNSSLFDNIDVAFLGLHGEWGEDGIIQSLFELRNIKYTGSDVLASSLTMDKMMSKIVMRDHNISVPDGFVIDKKYSYETILQKIKNDFKFPLIVKPNDQGSTFGLTVCEKEEDIKDALVLSFKYSDKTLIEEFIPGRELTVGILADEVFPVLEIRPKHKLYDYECKYTKGMSEYIVPAELPEQLAEQIKEQAQRAFISLGCRGYARVDFRLNDGGKFYCLEVNSLPGMTATSLLPKAAKAVGISFTQLVEKIVNLALS
ncbi:MAG: D-alanine--D-alanine ligase [Ignavibacteriaceae bacterium]|jgi:D-alanine-D-alanine ligase|nr:D-alanine--D-alanine ligase [Ignavibacteriaceae bacterium]